jgi:hypothetical protein
MEREIVGLALALASGSCVVLALPIANGMYHTRVFIYDTKQKQTKKLDNSQGNVFRWHFSR